MLRRVLPVLVVATIAASACADRPDGSSPVAPTVEAPRTNLSRSLQEPAGVPGRVLVRFVPGAPEDQLLSQVGATYAGDLRPLRIRLLSVPVGAEARVAAALAQNPNVEFAEQDIIVPFGPVTAMPVNDPFIGYKWDLDNDGTVTNSSGNVLATTGKVDADMDWKEAVEQHPTASGTARIGILDTGIRTDHEEFVGRIAAAQGFLTGNPGAEDDHGHGSHVAGIAGARSDNAAGVAGVAYTGTIQFVIAKVCGTTGCPSSSIANGIYWAVDQGADVLNLSLGGAFPSSTQQAALQYARANGVLAFCSSGNDNGPVSYPAAFPECVAVGATDWSDNRASYSNFGAQVELSAPGGDSEHPSGYSYIASAYNSGPSSYVLMAGTSMAAPQVTGAAALLKAFDPSLTDSEILSVLKTTADDLGPGGRDDFFGEGRINVAAAVAAVVGGSPPPPPPPPPGNEPPRAAFDADCTDLRCTFTDQSTDSDGSVVSWAWTFGDGGSSSDRSPSHTFPSAGTYVVTLTVTDDDGAGDSASRSVTVTEPSSGGIVLTLAGWKDKGRHVVDLAWSGASGNTVDVWKDGGFLVNTANDGAYRDTPNQKGKATYRYRVCEAGTTATCSGWVSVSF